MRKDLGCTLSKANPHRLQDTRVIPAEGELERPQSVKHIPEPPDKEVKALGVPPHLCIWATVRLVTMGSSPQECEEAQLCVGLGVELDALKRYVEALIPDTWEYDFIWKQSLCRYNQIKMSS